MKRMLCLLLAVCGLFGGALAHEADMTVLLEGLEHYEWPDLNRSDTMYRPVNQPWTAQTENGKLRMYRDYVDAVNEDVLFLRMTLNLQSDEKLTTPHVEITLGDTVWALTAMVATEEYDGTYYQDYMVYFTDESIDALKAMIRANGQLTIDIDGVAPYHAEISVPPEELADLYDRYVNAGGLRQRFEMYHSEWPLYQRDANGQ